MTPLEARNAYLVRTYGITLEQYNRQLQAQGYVCAVCGVPPKTMPLNVDHDHKTKLNRGLVCWFCNKHVIGAHRDSTILRAAADYIDNPPMFAVLGKTKPAPKPRKRRPVARRKVRGTM